jgi:crossover junction endodeoxyribonuclease RuvC
VTTTAPAQTTHHGPTVIGLDTSLTATGIASSRGWVEVIGYQKARTKDPGITQLPHPARREALHELLHAITDSIGRPDLAVLELPAPSRSGGGAHERGWLWWQIYNHCAALEIPIGLMTPNHRMQYATGKGAATKNLIVDAVARRWPTWPTNGDDNAADAVVLMAAGRDWLGHPITDLPKTHRAAIDKATWPTLPGDPR